MNFQVFQVTSELLASRHLIKILRTALAVVYHPVTDPKTLMEIHHLLPLL